VSKVVLCLLATVSAFRSPVISRVPARLQGAADVAEIKKAVLPADIGETSQAILSWTGLALGVGGLAKPAFVASKTLGIATSGASDVLVRGASLAALLLGARLGRDGDRDAAKSALLWMGGWHYILRGSTGVAGRTATVCGLLALSAARRSGGLWNALTTLDTDGLSSILPRDRTASFQNIVGAQMMAWGLGLWFAPDFLVTNLMGRASVSSTVIKGLAINNLVLGGKVMAGSEDDAKTNGLLFFGGWAAIMLLAKNAGTMSGQYILPCLAWNAACAAYTVVA